MNHPPYPAISANTLFHFTGHFDNLVSILTNEFHPRFSLENFNVLSQNAQESAELEWAVPMVCFCDIPLSQIGFHLQVYGDYGIGLTKDWGKRNGIAPVLYAYRESILTSKVVTILTKMHDEHVGPKLLESLGTELMHLVFFIKPYEGDLWREGGKLTNVRFYNEREWRFVPTLPEEGYSVGMVKADFLNEELRREANRKVGEISRISFDPNDIKYLVVRRDDEIVPLIREVERIKAKYSYDDVRLLASRVISAEQIRSDF